MKTTSKKKIKKVVKAWAVYGQWGHTGAWVEKIRAEKEARRLQRLGFSPSIFPCTITYELTK